MDSHCLKVDGHATTAKQQAIGEADQNTYAQLKGVWPVKLPSPCKTVGSGAWPKYLARRTLPSSIRLR